MKNGDMSLKKTQRNQNQKGEDIYQRKFEIR